MYKIECITNDVIQKIIEKGNSSMCSPDYGLDCSPDGECSPEDGSDDCDPYDS